jgi:probable O-glycosylation ligase (exosortase A-associated)
MYGVAVYYLYAVLRPQYIWIWALPEGVSWSLFAAIGTMIGAVLHLAGLTPTYRKEGTSPFARTHVALLLFALWIVVTYFTARDREVAWPWFVEYLKIFLMFFVSALLIQTVRHVWALAIVAAMAIGYISYEVNFLYFESGYMGIYFNGYGGLDNNGAGVMLAMGVPLCLFIYMSTPRWWRWVFAAQIPIILHAVLMTFSRGAMVALLVASPLVFIRGRHKFQLALAATAMLLVLPILAGPDIRREFFSVQEYQADGSAQSRFSSWDAAWRMAMDNPIFGVGVRNANLFSLDYGADMAGRTIHSQFLQVLADNGFPGLAFYLGTFVLAAFALRQVRRQTRHLNTDEGRIAYATACGIESALAVFCVGGVFLSLEVFELPYLLLLMAAQLHLAVVPQEAPVSVTVQGGSWTAPAHRARPAPAGAARDARG